MACFRKQTVNTARWIFHLQSCVNERKQGSASQGLHCDTAYRSTFSSLIEGNLQEFQPSLFTRPSLMVIPTWDTWKTAFQHPAIREDV